MFCYDNVSFNICYIVYYEGIVSIVCILFCYVFFFSRFVYIQLYCLVSEEFFGLLIYYCSGCNEKLFDYCRCCLLREN